MPYNPTLHDDYRDRTITTALENSDSYDPNYKSSRKTNDDSLLGFPSTDLGNAERFAAMHGTDIHYLYDWKQWFDWDGKQWKRDAVGAIYQRAKDTVREIYRQASKIVDDNQRKELIKFASSTESKSKLTAMIELARSEAGIPIIPENFDKDPMLLNAKNGTINLQTGELQPHRRGDLITKMAPVDYDEKAICPQWGRFLHKIMNGNENLIQFLQRAVGYALTADVSEQVLFFLYGTGANGKTTFLETCSRLLGDYAKQAEPEILMQKRNDAHPTGIADLMGARFVSTTEVGEGQRTNEVKVKQLTGGDTLKARFMNKDFFEFPPTHKIWLAANHKPVIRGTDNAIWRRIRLIPFEVTIPENERIPLAKMMMMFWKEYAGILAWTVRGCLDWQENGLGTPQEVTAATEAFRNEMDIVGDFLDECCIVKATAKAKASEIYAKYKGWCDENGEKPMGQKMFGGRLTEREFKRKRESTGYFWLGVGLLHQDKFSFPGEPSGEPFAEKEKVAESNNDVGLESIIDEAMNHSEPSSHIDTESSLSYRAISEQGSPRFISKDGNLPKANDSRASTVVNQVPQKYTNGSSECNFLKKWESEYGCNLTHIDTALDLALQLEMFKDHVGRKAKLKACLAFLEEMVTSSGLIESGGLYQLRLDEVQQ